MGSFEETEVAVRVGSRLLRRHGAAALNTLSVIEAIPDNERPSMESMEHRFESRANLYCAVLERAMTDAREYAIASLASGPQGLVQFAEEYLSSDHVNNCEQGCAMAAVGSELQRATEEVRAVFTLQLELLVRDLVRVTGAARARVLALIAMCVGGVTLARAHDDLESADELLAATRAAAVLLARG